MMIQHYGHQLAGIVARCSPPGFTNRSAGVLKAIRTRSSALSAQYGQTEFEQTALAAGSPRIISKTGKPGANEFRKNGKIFRTSGCMPMTKH